MTIIYSIEQRFITGNLDASLISLQYQNRSDV